MQIHVGAKKCGRETEPDNGRSRQAILEEKSMSRIYWVEAIRTIIYIQNRISASRAKVLPHELYFGRNPNFAPLRVFGSIAYAHVTDER